MKDASIRPLSEVSRDSVERYLLSRGSRSEMIAWKYFDARFNRGRERGLVWLHRGEVRGFIGLIPYRLRSGETFTDAVWTCDWSIEDPRRSPGMGIVILRAAIDAAPMATSLGGNELTRALLPRIAAQTIENAGVVFVLPLRLGHLLEKVDRRVARFASAVPALAGTPLASIPLPRRAAGTSPGVKVVPGVSRELEPIVAQRQDGASSPVYDFEYVDWQCGRCPEIEAWTCLAAETGGEPSGAIVFRRRSAPAHWRMVWWVGPSEGPQAAAVLSSAGALVHQRSGVSLSVLVSAADDRKAALLQAHGFVRERGGHPLYVSVADRARGFTPLHDVRGLSFLDTDLAHLP